MHENNFNYQIKYRLHLGLLLLLHSVNMIDVCCPSSTSFSQSWQLTDWLSWP